MNSTPATSPISSFRGPILGSVATGLSLASAGILSAEIVYNNTPVALDLQPHTITLPGAFNSSLEITFDPGTQAQGSPGMKIFIPGTTSFFELEGQNAGVAALSFGATVNDGVNYAALPAIQEGGDHYFGFKSFGNNWFGWLRISHNPGEGDGSATLLEYAYDNSGAAIIVGDTASPIPEPASATAIAALLAGSAAMLQRRRRVLAAA